MECIVPSSLSKCFENRTHNKSLFVRCLRRDRIPPRITFVVTSVKCHVIIGNLNVTHLSSIIWTCCAETIDELKSITFFPKLLSRSQIPSPQGVRNRRRGP